ncbi:MAG TPA: PspC domain-containing protein [Chloroflexi bacterium]|jgi:phage shock protein C|nr:PspC domain-containing protein [Chloroflexota bacterium]
MNRLYRSKTDSYLGGVCGGLGAYFHIDPLLVRIAFVALAMTNGLGITLYILLWLLLPSAHVAYDRQSAPGNRSGGPWNDTPAGNRWLLAGVALVGLGLVLLLDNLGLLWWLSFSHLLPLLLIAMGVVILMSNLRDA